MAVVTRAGLALAGGLVGISWSGCKVGVGCMKILCTSLGSGFFFLTSTVATLCCLVTTGVCTSLMKGFSCSIGGDGGLLHSLLPLLLALPDTDLILLPSIRLMIAPLLSADKEDSPAHSTSLSEEAGDWLREEMPESDPEWASLW